MRVASIAAGLLLFLPASGLAQGSCRVGNGSIQGRVVDSDGQGLARALIVAIPADCGTVSDSAGYFHVGGLPNDSVVLSPRPLGFCVEPRWVQLSDRGLQIFRGVVERSPGDDSHVPVEGLPYLPRSYAELTCQAAMQRFHYGRATEPFPTPREVLSIVLREPSVIALLATAAARREIEVVPVAFRYGPVEGQVPVAPTPYVLGGTERDAGVYILVETAEPLLLSVQVGRPSPTEREDGFQLEWRRQPGENWASARVVDQWGASAPR